MPGRLRRPRSCFREPSNYRQETGSSPIRSTANIICMNTRPSTHPAQPHFSLGRFLVPFIVLLLQWIACRACATAAVVATPRITLIVFADKPMPEGEWQSLFRDLREDYSVLAVQTHVSLGAFDIIRGDSLIPGLEVDSSISIYLHGECTLRGQPGLSVPQGTLGWVLRNQGNIEPFIHVDCSRIGEMLTNYAQGMNHDLRNNVMAEAISRVVLHEWIHVATQSPMHGRDGVAKSSFRVADLIPSFWPQVAAASHGK